MDSDRKDEFGIRNLFNSPARRIVTVDVERYKALLDDPSLSEAEKEEFLQALWSIVVAFVDLGFGVHPLQEVCEQEESASELKEAFDKADKADSNNESKRDGGPTGSREME